MSLIFNGCVCGFWVAGMMFEEEGVDREVSVVVVVVGVRRVVGGAVIVLFRQVHSLSQTGHMSSSSSSEMFSTTPTMRG